MNNETRNGHGALRRGRLSTSHATYFTTLCTDYRCQGLTEAPVATAILTEAKKLDSDTTWTLRCATVMPDHIHLLLTLGERLPLEKAISRLKSKTSAILRLSNIKWERGFFDRKLREEDSVAAIIRYIYMNPYRTDPPLIGSTAEPVEWPWFYCTDADWMSVKEAIEVPLLLPPWLPD